MVRSPRGTVQRVTFPVLKFVHWIAPVASPSAGGGICNEISQFRGVNRGLAAGALNLLGFFPHGDEPQRIALATLLQ